MLKGESFLIRSNIILQHCTRLTKHLVAAKAVSCAAVLRSVCLTDTQQHRLYTIYSCDLTDIVGNKSLQPHLSRVSVLIPFCPDGVQFLPRNCDANLSLVTHSTLRYLARFWITSARMVVVPHISPSWIHWTVVDTVPNTRI